MPMKNNPQQKPITKNSARNVVILLIAAIVGAGAMTFVVAQSANPANKNLLPANKSNQTAPTGSTTTSTTSPTSTTSDVAQSSPTTLTPKIPGSPNSADSTLLDTDISKILDAAVKTQSMPGMAAAVILNGKILGVGQAGVRKRDMPDPILRDDPFHLGTCTKALTATMIGVLVDEGKLKWDSTIGDLIGREISGITPDYASVTIDQLLHHRGGLSAHGPTEVWEAAKYAKGPAAQQRRVYVEAVLMQAAQAPVGKYVYSNAGYAVLGYIAETITNTPYEQLMQEKVFTPLGLTSAGFGNAGNAQKLSAPYPHIQTGLPNFVDSPAAITAAGRIHMNMTDWAKFCLMHLGHQPTPPLLKPETLEHLHELAGEVPADGFGYAGGWMRPNRDWAGGRTLFHVGTNTFNYCVVWLSPLKDCGVLVACNQGGKKAQSAVDQAANELIARFMPAAKK